MGPEEEFELFDTENRWMSVFQKLHSSDAARRHQYSLQESRLPDNRSRNRYRDVVPYDHSRVKLERSSLDYINASLVVAAEADRSYILTQGPVPTTAGHFWLMIWEQKSRAVIMLNRIIEKGQLKCHPYYPTGSENEGEDEMEFADVGLKVTYVEEKESNVHYTARVFYITDTESSETREVIQFHYTAWPDFGVPTSPGAFLDFLWAVRASEALDTTVHGPPVIHCSAGIGRSGTFCLVDACLVLVEKYRSASEIRVLDVLMDMRRYRMGLVQTFDQLRFSYLAIIEGIRRIIHIPSRDSGYDNSVEDSVHKRRDSEQMSTDEDSDTDDGVDYEGDENMAATALPSHEGSVKPASSGQQNGVCPENSRPVDGLANDVKGPRFRWLEHREIRRRPMEEREKNSREQMERMKRRQQQLGILPSLRRRTVVFYIVRITLATLIAVGGYGLFRYIWR